MNKFILPSKEKFPVSNAEKKVMLHGHLKNVAVYFSEMNVLDNKRNDMINYINDLHNAISE